MLITPRTSCARAAQNLTHFGRVVHLLLCIFLLSSCQNNELEISSTQRELGELNIDSLDLRILLSPGILRDVDERNATITGRASAGVGTVTIRAGAEAQQETILDLNNIHPNAHLTARRTRTIATTEPLGEGCGDTLTSTFDIDCTQDASQCPVTELERLDGTRTIFTIPVTPCAETTYDLDLSEELEQEPLTFVVVGSMNDPTTLATIDINERAMAGGPPDFYMVLGDAIEKKGNAFVSDLEDVTDALESVVIVTPGEQEFGDDRGQYYERRFGAFEYRWTIKSTQFISFYSAQQQLNARSLGSLRSSLRAMQAEDQQWRTARDIILEEGQGRALPAFAMTHTPLFDPSGPRNAGFKSRLEAGQVSSLLASSGIHTLFAGHIRDNAHITTTRPNLVLTTTQDTRTNNDLAIYRRVTISRTEQPGSTPVGVFFMTLETIALP